MQLPSHIATVEWMRDLFGAFDKYIVAEVETLPPEFSRIINNPPADVEGLRHWILNICKVCQTTPSHLAKLARLSPSTVNRFLKAKNDNASLNANTIVALEKSATQLALKLIDERPVDWSSFSSDDPQYDHPRETLFQFGLAEIPVLGMIALNGESLSQDFKGRMSESYKITVPAPSKYQNSYLFAFELVDFRDEKIDLQAREFVVCIPSWFDDVKLNGNERVLIVERPRVETVSAGVRDLSRDDRGNIWLMPISQDVGAIEPSFLGRETVPLTKGRVGVALIILASYRSFEWAE